jgi:hypothetical protein
MHVVNIKLKLFNHKGTKCTKGFWQDLNLKVTGAVLRHALCQKVYNVSLKLFNRKGTKNTKGFW